jgi:hypothetical protein
MKPFIFPILLFVSAGVLAQNPSSKDSTTNFPTDILKINLTSLPLKNLHIQYEHALSRKISLALGARVMPVSAIPLEKQVLDAVGSDDEDTRDLINYSRIGNIAITPEVRFYLGKGYGRGFYVAPYYRFASFSTNTIYLKYSDGSGIKRNLTMNGELTAHTGGILLGAQLFMGKRLTLDWWILGAHYGTASGSFMGTPSTPFTAGEQEDIRQTLDDIEIPLVKKTVNVSANNITVNTNGAFGGLRGGILLGFRF